MISKRETMLKVLGEYFPIAGLSEDFDGTDGGIWICGECGYTNAVGVPFFDYYDQSPAYVFGVLSNLSNLVERHGWYFEWYDAGTIMCFPG